jgi:hypothetical protein
MEPRRYTIKKFYDLMRTVVEIEMRYNGEKVERVSKKMDIRQVEVRVVSECPIKGVIHTGKQIFKAALLSNRERALNCGANAAHSANSGFETGRPTIRSYPANCPAENVAENQPEKYPAPPDISSPDRIRWANETFAAELQEDL